MLVDQGLVVASVWVKSVLLPHILLDRGGGSDIAAAPTSSLHVNRRVAPSLATAGRFYLLFGWQAFGAGDGAEKLRGGRV